MAPEVSIITPCYNAQQTLARTIESVLSQDFQSWELLLVDDKSTDDTCLQAEAFCDHDDRIKLIKLKKNAGAAVARNTGIDSAKGRYIAFIDADDQWENNKLSIQIGQMKEHGWPLSYTAYTRVDQTDSCINKVGVPATVHYRYLLKTNYIGCSTAIYDSEQLGKVFMPELRKRQDFGLWLRILKKTDFGYGINLALTRYRVQQVSLSANKRNTVAYNWRLYRDVERLNLLMAGYYFANYAIRGLLRSRTPRLAQFLGVHFPVPPHSTHSQ
ncbi:glycosyltransferase family 2 protein [Alcanivorax sp.]|jgi:glycosyltransferase involved in cell wall biosynthesis|uniref:glycosyltransferase family 2 protein n=2 Tax=Alcanivorax sp. TaxID=1872427 RepID=UPI003BAB1F08